MAPIKYSGPLWLCNLVHYKAYDSVSLAAVLHEFDSVHQNRRLAKVVLPLIVILHVFTISADTYYIIADALLQSLCLQCVD